MITKIREYFTYRKQVKLLKKYAVGSIVSFIADKEKYAEGLNKIVSAVMAYDSVEDIQKAFVNSLAEVIHVENESVENEK